MPTNIAADRTGVERRVLDIISTLVSEIRGDGLDVAVTRDDRLEGDLGISSLERIELWLRLEQAFGVRLPDSLMAEAERPVDLIAALLTAGPLPDEAPAAQPLRQGPRAAPPSDARTLVEVLEWHARATPDRVQVVLWGDEKPERTITYGALWEQATAMAAGLRHQGLARGESVALMLRTEEAFFPAFFGALIAGCVPVPIYPPFRADRIEEYARRQSAILKSADARLLITFAQAERVAGLLRGRAPALASVIPADRLGVRNAPVPALRPGPEDPALIQYTSGSTGDPKGVLLSHGNLLANIRAIGQALEIGPDDVVVSWLPLYHDMGLIGSWLGAFYFGLPAVIMSPLAFLSRPSRWLRAVHTYGGTISPAPNFAFDLCARKIRDEELEGLDLSRWRLALNGSEMVSPDTIDRFTRRFGRYGFKPEAMTPVYGLAESSVGVTFSPVARSPRVDRIAREAFQRSRAIVPAALDDASPLRFVSCGSPLPDHEIRLVDDAGLVVGARVEGRVEFRGPSSTRGYFRNPKATQAVLHDGWMDSGDLGYRLDDELFITGRRKDVIIQAGRNVYPQEVEEVAAAVPGIRQGCVAAFGVFDQDVGTERLVVVAETRETAAPARARLREALVSRVVTALAISPDIVVMASPGAVLKTSSGKVRRAATREAYVSGHLERRSALSVQWAGLLLGAGGARAGALVEEIGRWLFTSYVLAILGLTLPVLRALLAFVPDGRPSDRLVKGWSRLALALTGLSPDVAGAEHLAGIGPAVLVANHSSYIDSIVLMSAVATDFSFVAKRALLTYPLLGLVLRKAGHLLIEKAEWSSRLAGANEVSEALGKGRSLVIFPEGTFVRGRGLLPFRLGAFRAAVETGCPVVPIAIRGTRDVLPDGTRFLTRRPITVTIGPPVRPEGEGWPEMVRLRDLARTEIAGGCGEAPV
jgi:fatty-acyl-CoA synthase